MKRYTEVEFRLTPLEPWRDILLAELTDLGYEGAEETREGLKAYVPTASYDVVALGRLLVMREPHVQVSHAGREVPDINWNAQWESSFQPVEVDGRVRIRAEFHPSDPSFEQELIITPRMAFGTGHHATTRMMITAMQELDLRGKDVCDLGCGTAVLGMLAERMGARSVLAIDNDELAVTNARENVERNGCERTTVEKGDAGALGPMTFHAILANIERNTLMRAMTAIQEALLPGGTVLLSGFVVTDAGRMKDAAVADGLRSTLELMDGEWALLACEKPMEP
jgi:ribosomal protein L11 methyltransferase